MHKVDLKENWQPTDAKMVNDIVSANNFHIFCEFYDLFFFFILRSNLALKIQFINKLLFG